jgi:hypothetical protein
MLKALNILKVSPKTKHPDALVGMPRYKLKTT